jgi:hypothetical protein
MEEVDKEISEMKLSLNARARVVAESYLTAVCYIPYLSVSLAQTLLSSTHDHVTCLSMLGNLELRFNGGTLQEIQETCTVSTITMHTMPAQHYLAQLYVSGFGFATCRRRPKSSIKSAVRKI